MLQHITPGKQELQQKKLVFYCL